MQLAREAEGDQAALDMELSQLSSSVSLFRERIAGLVARTVPTVEDLRLLQSRRGLRLVRMERLTPEGSSDRTTDCRLVLFGTSGNLVSFLRDLETSYVARTASLAMRPANEDGSIVAMEITLQVTEQ